MLKNKAACAKTFSSTPIPTVSGSGAIRTDYYYKIFPDDYIGYMCNQSSIQTVMTMFSHRRGRVRSGPMRPRRDVHQPAARLHLYMSTGVHRGQLSDR